MAPTFIVHCAHMCEVIRPGDTVLDLACGPATQLGMLARLNPDARFIGIDLSAEMLEQAEHHVTGLGLDNVELRVGDITTLDRIASQGMDAVVSTMSLHHLPTLELLDTTFPEARRVLKPDGGLYLADFVHLRSERSIRYFAYQHADRQPELFTLDYFNSLRAAFYFQDFQRLVDQYFGTDARLFATAPFRFMIAIKSHQRREAPMEIRTALREIAQGLAPPQQKDLKDLNMLFRLGGMRTALLP